MDAEKFVEERNRMCKSFGNICSDCPAYKNICCNYFEWQKELVAIVEEWSAAHPRKTRQSVFLEQYPETEIDARGYLQLCPKYISADCRIRYKSCSNRLCRDCRKEFWSQEI